MRVTSLRFSQAELEGAGGATYASNKLCRTIHLFFPASYLNQLIFISKPSHCLTLIHSSQRLSINLLLTTEAFHLATMGAWGADLFEGDGDLDVADDISGDAGMDLYLPDAEECGGKGFEHTRAALSAGLLTKLSDKYKKDLDRLGEEDLDIKSLDFTQSAPNDEDFAKLDEQFEKESSKYFIVILAALAMQLGANIKQEEMDLVRAVFQKTADLSEEKRNQMTAALDGYENGKAWDFGSKGPIETMMDAVDDRNSAPKE